MTSGSIEPAGGSGDLHWHSRMAARILTAFLFTFIAARILVFLIMLRRLPDLYVHLGGTHIHHLNYGIFLLAGVGAYLLFRRPAGSELSATALAYGIGLGLTFDEFGMWVHLGGGYWQRASFDAVTVIAVLLGLVSSAPRVKQFRPWHWAIVVILIIALFAFGGLLAESLKHASHRIGPYFHELERQGPQ